MAQVPEKVLAWLYSVLHEYHNPQRTYSDTVRVLSAYPSLSPQTEVYTYESGSHALLLTLSGTIPATFRGTAYHFPIKIWLPHSYPQESPIGYVPPGRDMLVRPGQHVGVDGRVYHPYLRDWSRMWDRASTVEFLEYLQQVFAKEPPVISKAQQQQYQRPVGQPQQQASASPAPPRLPPKQNEAETEPQEMPSTDVPPPRPPKPGEEYADPQPSGSSSRNVIQDGPPLPPLPHDRPQNQHYNTSQQYSNGFDANVRPPSQVQLQPPQQPPPPQRLQSYPSGRPLGPPIDQRRLVGLQQPSNFDRSPISPVSPVNGYSELPGNRYNRPAPLPPQSLPTQAQRPPPPQYQHLQQQQQQQQQPPPPQQHLTPAPYPQNPPNPQYPPNPQPAAPPPKQLPPDLLSDPFDIALPSGPTIPDHAPPIPPNPEKEHLLRLLSNTLVAQAQHKTSQNLSALSSLHAQHAALSNAQTTLQAELSYLATLDAQLATNEALLRASLDTAAATLADAAAIPAPRVDDLLSASSLVASQLWASCATAAAARDCMYLLQRAVDRGRINSADFVRVMRKMGRERFLRMVVARKCAHGMGLDLRGGVGG